MMLRTTVVALLGFLTLFPSLPVSAQEKNSANTYRRGEDFQAPVASLEDLQWISGRWTGQAMGGDFEESWSPPSAGSMLGMFKFSKDEEVNFYELLTIVVDGDSLLLRLKHFGSDLKGWEAKDETVEFPLVRLKKNEANFEGLTFRRIDGNHLHIYVNTAEEGAAPQEIEFRATRSTFRAQQPTDSVPDGLYLVQRWSIESSSFKELLPGEFLLEHDLREIEPGSKDPLKFVTVNPTVGVPFSQLATAKPIPQADGRISLDVKFDKQSAKRLEQISRRHLGRQVAIVFDGRITTMHKIRSIISGGQLQISRCTDNGCETILRSIQERSAK